MDLDNKNKAAPLGLPEIDDDADGDERERPSRTRKTVTRIVVLSGGVAALLAGAVGMKDAVVKPAVAPARTPINTASTSEHGEDNQQNAAIMSRQLTIDTTERLTLLESRVARESTQWRDWRNTIAAEMSDLNDWRSDLSRTQKSVVNNLIRTVDALSDRVDALSSDVEAAVRQRDKLEIMKVRKWMNEINARVMRVDRRARRNWTELHGDAGAHRRSTRLPFTIESIDLWDGSPSVVVRYDDDMYALREGDAALGWRLVRADPREGHARFRRKGTDALAEVGQ